MTAVSLLCLVSAAARGLARGHRSKCDGAGCMGHHGHQAVQHDHGHHGHGHHHHQPEHHAPKCENTEEVAVILTRPGDGMNMMPGPHGTPILGEVDNPEIGVVATEDSPMVQVGGPTIFTHNGTDTGNMEAIHDRFVDHHIVETKTNAFPALHFGPGFKQDALILLVEGPDGKMTLPTEVLQTCNSGSCPVGTHVKGPMDMEGEAKEVDAYHAVGRGMCWQTRQHAVQRIIDVIAHSGDETLGVDGFLHDDTMIEIEETLVHQLRARDTHHVLAPSDDSGDDEHMYAVLEMHVDQEAPTFTEKRRVYYTRRDACDPEINALWKIMVEQGYCEGLDNENDEEDRYLSDVSDIAMQAEIDAAAAAGQVPDQPVATTTADQDNTVSVTVHVNLDGAAGSFAEVGATAGAETSADRVTRKKVDQEDDLDVTPSRTSTTRLTPA